MKSHPTLSDLLQTNLTGTFDYNELLCTQEWALRRSEIIRRDHSLCKACGKTETMSDSETNPYETIYYWFGAEKWQAVKNQHGSYVDEYLPEFIPSDKPYRLEVHHHC